MKQEQIINEDFLKGLFQVKEFEIIEVIYSKERKEIVVEYEVSEE